MGEFVLSCIELVNFNNVLVLIGSYFRGFHFRTGFLVEGACKAV